jgi:hypothetical protein
MNMHIFKKLEELKLTKGKGWEHERLVQIIDAWNADRAHPMEGDVVIRYIMHNDDIMFDTLREFLDGFPAVIKRIWDKWNEPVGDGDGGEFIYFRSITQ